jgi:hypothetical protein
MAVLNCGGCGRLFGVDDQAVFYCSPDCRQKAHRRYLSKPLETRQRLTPRPTRRTMSLTEAWQSLGDEEQRIKPLGSIHGRSR